MGFDERFAAGIARKACEAAGFQSDGLTSLRLGQNAIFHEPEDSLVVRVHRPSRSVDQIEKEVAVSKHLEELDFPSVRIHQEVELGWLLVDGHPVSFWQFVPSTGDRLTNYSVFGRILREFHEAMEGFKYPLDRYRPFDTMYERIAQFESEAKIPRTILSSLRHLVDSTSEAMVKIPEQFQTSKIIHGDAHTGNIILSPGGPVLTDFEQVSLGAPYWDVAPLLVTLRRFRGDASQRADFLTSVGIQLPSQQELEIVLIARELYMLCWLLQNYSITENAAKQAVLRLRSLERSDATAEWTPL